MSPAVIEQASADVIRSRILAIRGAQVMLGRDLAELYGVEVGQLNRQVKRNPERFPNDFMFQLSREEWSYALIIKLTSQWHSATPKRPSAHHRPFVEPVESGSRYYRIRME